MALNAITNVFRIAELRTRLAYTLVLLAVYRLGIFINTPGRGPRRDERLHGGSRRHGRPGSLFNMFSGGALEQMSIFALGIMPYVSASIIMQLLRWWCPARAAAEGRRGGPAEDQPVHALRHDRPLDRPGHRHLALAGLARPQHDRGRTGGIDQSSSPTTALWFTFMTVITLTAGTAFIMWLGEQITERGIGNGISLIIFAGIVARHAARGQARWSTVDAGRHRASARSLVLLAFMVAGRSGWWSTSSAACGASRCSTPSGWRAGRCSPARPRTSR